MRFESQLLTSSCSLTAKVYTRVDLWVLVDVTETARAGCVLPGWRCRDRAEGPTKSCGYSTGVSEVYGSLDFFLHSRSVSALSSLILPCTNEGEFRHRHHPSAVCCHFPRPSARSSLCSRRAIRQKIQRSGDA